ncbi:unnamed protein product, partial [Didymodactylos carnosus]
SSVLGLEWCDYLNLFLIISHHSLFTFDCLTHELTEQCRIRQSGIKSLCSISVYREHLFLIGDWGTYIDHWSLTSWSLIKRLNKNTLYYYDYTGIDGIYSAHLSSNDCLALVVYKNEQDFIDLPNTSLKNDLNYLKEFSVGCGDLIRIVDLQMSHIRRFKFDQFSIYAKTNLLNNQWLVKDQNKNQLYLVDKISDGMNLVNCTKQDKIMPLFHFGNCLALACGPVLLTYKYSGLAEYNAFWKCVQSAAFYFFVQFVKMLTIATCFPPVDESKFVVRTEILKNTVDILDVIGLHFVLTRICGKTEIKYLVVAVGWASAELVVTKFLPLWVGARGIEFDWKYIQMSLDSNIALIHHLSVTMLIWLRTRNDLNKSYMPFVNVLLFLCCYRPLIIE